MLKLIVEEIKDILESELSFADLVCGLSQNVKKTITDENGKAIQKNFPVYYDAKENDGSYIDLTLDDSYKSMLYFKEIATLVKEDRQSYIIVNSTVRLICWWNYKAVNKDTTNSLMSAYILSKLPASLPDMDFLNGIQIKVLNMPKNDSAIFSEYSYNEAETQFLLYPYDFFSVELGINYRFSKPCVPDIELNPSIC